MNVGVREGQDQKEGYWRNNKKQEDGSLVGSDSLAKGLRSQKVVLRSQKAVLGMSAKETS